MPPWKHFFMQRGRAWHHGHDVLHRDSVRASRLHKRLASSLQATCLRRDEFADRLREQHADNVGNESFRAERKLDFRLPVSYRDSVIGDHLASWKRVNPGESLVRSTCSDLIDCRLQSGLYHTIPRSGSQSAGIEGFDPLNGWCPIVPVFDVRKDLPYSAWTHRRDELFCRSH
jgi:hypothetical protein